jgi:dGTPase
MDCSDDITYGVHDVEDFFRIGILPPEVFDSNSGERARFCDQLELASGLSRDDIEAGLAPLGLLFTRYQGREIDIAQLSEFRSAAIDRLISALQVRWRDDFPSLEIPTDTQIEISVLKALTRQYVIQRASVQAQRYGQLRMVRTLYEIYVDAATARHDSDNRLQIFPALYQDRIRSLGDPGEQLQAVKRYVSDLIAAMTEPQLVDTFAKLTGQSQGSVIDPIA